MAGRKLLFYIPAAQGTDERTGWGYVGNVGFAYPSGVRLPQRQYAIRIISPDIRMKKMFPEGKIQVQAGEPPFLMKWYGWAT